jgi:hypothetical protein
MPFAESAKHYIAKRPNTDRVAITLKYLLQKALGRKNAVPIETVLKHLAGKGHKLNKEQFQTTILKSTRASDIFIASSKKGVFLIEDVNDARTMADFYSERIKAEKANLEKLRTLATLEGWNIS